MNILILTGSPHKKGTSARLVEEFTKGATEAGHKVERFDSAFADVAPCKGCYYCRKHQGVCRIKDDMEPLTGETGLIATADMIVFATPLYYFGMSAQLKAVVDRFYALGRSLREKNQKSALLATAGDPEERVIKGLVEQYQLIAHWCHWQETGTVLALGCHDMEQLEDSPYPAAAYTLGKSL